MASPPGCRGPLGGSAGLQPPRSASGCPRAGGGEGGEGGGGGFPGPLPSPLAPLSSGLVVLVPRGQPPTGGMHLSPALAHPSGARLSCRRLTRGAGWPEGGGEGGSAGAWGGGSGQWLAASGLRGPAAPYGGGAWECALGRGARPCWRVSRGTGPSPSPCAPHLGRRGAAVTYVAACRGAEAAAAVGSAGGSASG